MSCVLVNANEWLTLLSIAAASAATVCSYFLLLPTKTHNLQWPFLKVPFLWGSLLQIHNANHLSPVPPSSPLKSEGGWNREPHGGGADETSRHRSSGRNERRHSLEQRYLLWSRMLSSILTWSWSYMRRWTGGGGGNGSQIWGLCCPWAPPELRSLRIDAPVTLTYPSCRNSTFRRD